MRRIILIASITFLIAIAGYPQARGLQPQDVYKEVTISDVALSPSGDLVAFTVMNIVEEENRRHWEIWMQRLDAGAPVGEPFRFTSPTEESSSPRWSPDGNLLSFISKRGRDKNNVWFIRVAAPGGEGFHIEGIEGAPVWSPDGKWIAYTKEPLDENEDKEDEREGWIAPDAITKTLDPKRFDGRVITHMNYKRDGIQSLLPHPSAREKSQLFVVSADGGEPVRLTDLPFDVSGIEWSPDSSYMLFTGEEKENDEYNREYTMDIYSVAREGGEIKRLTENPGSERFPAISPDGRKLAYIFTLERGAELDLMLVDIDSDGSFSGSRGI